MTDETLKLLQHAMKQKGANLATISPAAAEMCRIIDHHNQLHWHDRNAYGEKIKKLTEELSRLKEKVSKLEHRNDEA